MIYFNDLLGATFSGIVTVLLDILIKQTMVEYIVEKDKLSEDCKKYRRTHTHMLAVFLLGFIVFYLVKYTYLQRVYKYIDQL